MNVFKRMWIAYVTLTMGRQIVRDFERFINEYPREYERTSRMFRQFSERMNRINKEMQSNPN